VSLFAVSRVWIAHSGIPLKKFTPPLVDDPDHKLDTSQELNHVLIRIHKRNVHRSDGNTLNFNQQYFAGTFVTYLQFSQGLPDPVVLGFLLNCLERCREVGAAKAWGAGQLFLQAYTLERVECAYTREWDGEAFQLTRNEMITPLKTRRPWDDLPVSFSGTQSTCSTYQSNNLDRETRREWFSRLSPGSYGVFACGFQSSNQ